MPQITEAQEKLHRKYPLQVGKRYLQSGGGDHGIVPDARPFLFQELIVIKHLKSGLYQTQLPDGRIYPFPKSALRPVEDETYDYPTESKEF